MADVIVTDEGLLAVGPGDGAHGGSAAWLSADGTAWERFTIDDVAGLGPSRRSTVVSSPSAMLPTSWTSVPSSRGHLSTDGHGRPAVRSIPVRPFWTASAATDQRSSQAGSACRTSAITCCGSER